MWGDYFTLSSKLAHGSLAARMLLCSIYIRAICLSPTRYAAIHLIGLPGANLVASDEQVSESFNFPGALSFLYDLKIIVDWYWRE